MEPEGLEGLLRWKGKQTGVIDDELLLMSLGDGVTRKNINERRLLSRQEGRRQAACR